MDLVLYQSESPVKELLWTVVDQRPGKRHQSGHGIIMSAFIMVSSWRPLGKPMRILFFAEQFWPETNAPAIHVHERAKIWVRMGHSVTVVTSAPNFPEGRLFAGYQNRWRQVEWKDGIKVLRVKTFISPNQGLLRRFLDHASYCLSALLFSLPEASADVVLSTSPQLLVPLAGVLHAWLRRIPHVFELRDLWPASITAVGAVQPGALISLLERLELWLYRRSQRVLVFTDSFRRDLERRKIDPMGIEVTPNGTDLEMFQPGLRNPDILQELGLSNRFIVGYIGTLGMAHGLGSVLAAAKSLASDGVTFLLVGPGAAKEDLERQAHAMGLDNVVFLPRQPREAMPALWGLCDVALVQVKETEVFRTVIPSKLYEAIAMGLPICFAGPDGEASELVRRHGVGLVISSGDATELARAVRAFQNDKALLAASRAASIQARAFYSRTAQAERTLDALRRVVDSWSKKRP